ncbi:MAG: UDP-N-acetylmuramate dehydrogenase [Burkholderiales bacterium]|nr:UDP-N-acetylmuramate dehydrogenase [Nitrosomonas sp.]MCP5274620.1 UDP-N-acetylmuramate dehydrogenase [Burkholderiales bacterium]
MKTVFQIDKWNVNRLTGFFSSELSMRLVRGEMRINEPMSRHTSWRAGGIARRYFIPADLEDLGLFLQQLPVDEPVYMVGLGSNLLVRDGGLSGTVIAVHARLNDLQLMRQDSECGLIYAGAGVACAKVARFAAVHQLAGAEFLAGIPGTVGGALAMNAGCYGAETWEIIEQVQVITRSGKISVQSPGVYEIGYRSVQRKAVSNSDSEWFVGGYFRLKTGDEAVSRQKIRQLLTRRVQSQPLNKPNAGSVFRNPPGDHAARLIEACGLKGMRVGGAMVSTQHANFIVNIANASATDIETLIMMVQEKVKKETGVELMPEVHIIGKTGSNA